MLRPRSVQARFLVRATAAFAVLLVLWWVALRPALLWWCRVATDVVLVSIPGAPLRTGVIVSGDTWIVQAPVRVAGVWRNARVETGSRLPTQLTVAVPLFWAVLFAGGRFRREWTSWVTGTALVMAIPPLGLLLYVVHVVQMYAFPGSAGALRAAIAAGDYITTTVLPYAGPVLIGVWFHPELRRHVIGINSVFSG